MNARKQDQDARFFHLAGLIFLLTCCIFLVQACEDGGKENGATPDTPPLHLATGHGPEEKTSLSAAEQPSHIETEKAGEAGKITIGLAMGTLREERWRKDRDMFKAAAEALGAEVKVAAANEDDSLQIRQVEALISQGIDILVIVPHNAETAATVVEKAHASGIKVIAYDRLVNNSEIDLYVSFDNERVGELQAEAITQMVPTGKYVYIGGAETDYNSHLFKKGAFRVLQPYIDRGDIRIVYDQWSTDWSPAVAQRNMEEALIANHRQIDAVIAANDGTAGGVVKALEAHGLAGSIPLAGMDADLSAVQRIVDGTQSMTVYKPIEALSARAARLAVQMAQGEDVVAERFMHNGRVEVPSILLPPIAVDQSNLDETIIADDFHSREEVYREGTE